jgi:hypothetical protein
MELQRDFGCSDDRQQVLTNLVPGSEERFYLRCLDLQHRGELAEVPQLLQAWKDAHEYSSDRRREIELRQAMLTWSEDEGAREKVRSELGVGFHHSREVEVSEDQYPAKLPPEDLSWASLCRRPRRWDADDLDGFTPEGIERLARSETLADEALHALLARLERPDFDQLPNWIAADLAREDAQPFGSLTIHSKLTLTQLDTLCELRPKLLGERSFVNAYLQRLRPVTNTGDLTDPDTLGPYLERVLAFSDRLGDAWATLKLEVRYHLLAFDWRHGSVSEKRLREYLALPRHASYVKRSWLEERSVRMRACSFGTHHDLGLSVVHDDEALVRALLEEVLRRAPDTSAYEAWIETSYLRERRLTSRILAGVGDADACAKELDDPALLARLRDQVELRFPPGQRRRFDAEDPVEIALDVKNVSELAVKAFRINLENVFRNTGKDVDLSLNLDGLVPSHERSEHYDDPALHRVRRRFSFPELSEPGTYVVDFLGGGRNSRALIRRGGLRVVERPTSRGQVLRVVDDEGRARPAATVLLGGRVYRPDDEGRVLVPYTTSPTQAKVLLRDGPLTAVAEFMHRQERFDLSLGLHVDREQLVAGQEATLIVRAALTIHGAPANLEFLEEIRLQVTSVDQRGVESSRDLPIVLGVGDETRHTFRVPPEARQLAFEVSAALARPVTGGRQTFSAARSYTLNEIDSSPFTRALYLGSTAEGYRLELRGKTGEELAHQEVTVRVQPREIQETLSYTLQTDADGHLHLGDLSAARWVHAELGEGTERQWSVGVDRARLPQRIHTRAGEQVLLPYVGSAGAPTRSAFALFRLCAGNNLQDCFAQLRLDPGQLRLDGLEAGSYELTFKESGHSLHIEVGEGESVGRWLAGPRRLLELRNQHPLTLAPLELQEDALLIRLGGVTPRTRVHVIATRYAPEHDLFAELADVPRPAPRGAHIRVPASRFADERQLPQEVRYVLERDASRALPGNLAERPSLLLNPWAMRDTQTSTDRALGGGGFGAGAAMSACFDEMDAACEAMLGEAEEGSGFATYDFLPAGAVAVLGLRADSEGVVRVERSALGGAQQVRVLALDPQNAVERQLALPPTDLEPQDRRLLLALEPGEHFTEQRTVAPLLPGAELKVDDLTAAKLTRYDSLAKVHALFRTLNPNPALSTFEFVTRWPQLSREEQERHYDEHACHELHVFLYQRDRAFFDRVIAPYLRHKRHSTFVDDFLLERDLSGYARPWAYGRLNAVERILLGRALAKRRDAITRNVADDTALLPRDVEGDARRFDTALAGQALDEDDDLGIEGKKAQLSEARRDMAKESMPTGRSRKKRKSGAKAKPSKKSAAPPPAPGAGPSFSRLMSSEDDDEWGESERELDSLKADVELYRALDTTKEWGESDYYRLPPEDVHPSRVPTNPFWRDLAAHREGPFLSPHVAWASSSFTEQLFALAFLDLPFTADEAQVTFAGAGLTLGARSPLLVFRQEVGPAPVAADPVPILVGQKLLRSDDRYRYEDGEEIERYVEGELLTHVVYTCQVVVSNPTGASHKLDLLLQIPQGALPVAEAQRTESRRLHLSPFETESLEYSFYFPYPGTFSHYGVRVARHEEIVAWAPPRTCTVVGEPSHEDTSSWSYLSQRGSDDEVLAHLGEANLGRLDLDKIAWRCRERAFYERVIELLEARQHYHSTLWGYAVVHEDVPRARDYVAHQDSFLRRCGPFFEAPLASVDPVERVWYQHLEYAPLVNARAHRLGAVRKILNDRFRLQWERFLGLLRYRPTLTADDRLALVYYLLLQDRMAEAIQQLARVPRDAVHTQLQHDYLSAYVALSRGEPEVSRRLAEPHMDHAVPRWRKRFRALLSQLDELTGGSTQAVDPQDRDQRQAAAASRDATFSLESEGAQVRLRTHHLERVRVAYYRMDLELLFSLQPFEWEDSRRFAYTAPHAETELELSSESDERLLDPPAELAGQNLVVEAVAEGRREVSALYAHRLAVRLMEHYGQLEVRAASGEPLPATYVKAYGMSGSGEVNFYKDGYTDLRGRFDYASLSTNQLNQTEHFALLVASPTHGALVREVAAPQR